MPSINVEYDAFKIKAFIDANIVLEGRDLKDLPWQEIDSEGPIIVLITPTAIKEIDSKKHDGRIGRHARECNRIIASVLESGTPFVIREAAPRVELALAYSVRIPWVDYDILDPNEGDACIVAEALNAVGMSDDGKVLVSQDIKPLAFAKNFGLNTKHVSETWLRPKEPSPSEKEIQRLKSKLTMYETKEPSVSVKIDIIDNEPIQTFRIRPLTSIERSSIETKIIRNNPRKTQSIQHPIPSAFPVYDHEYDREFDNYVKKIPIYVKDYENRMARLFNQARYKVSVLNDGTVPAENLLIELSVSSGWFNDRFVWESPNGPRAPSPRNNRLQSYISGIRAPIFPKPTGRHDFAFRVKPNCSAKVSATCEDFRQNQIWTLEGIIGIDSYYPETIITVSLTASNLIGTQVISRVVLRENKDVHISEVIDQNQLKTLIPVPFQRNLQDRNFHNLIDWDAFAVTPDQGD